MQAALITDVVANSAAAVLRRIFGFEEFRPNQEAIVGAILAGRDVFAVMPTGGGKSLCFQLPAQLLHGTCVVISPLISLMKDQVDGARAKGIRAEFLNSSQNPQEQLQVFSALSMGNCDLLYVSPERFVMREFRDVLARLELSFFAIDEAHCISEWGHDFRPDYLALSEITRLYPRVPIAAFTATATRTLQGDVIRRLKLRNPLSVRASFDRPNLYYEVVEKTEVEKQALQYLHEHAGQSGIIYRATRSGVDDLVAWLQQRGFKAVPYHAGLTMEVRKYNQDLFVRGKVDVVVATIAFGMGIDKPDVRFVLHADLPRNLESYYQETGRAGRDGLRADCALLYSKEDIPRLRYFIDKMGHAVERQIATRKLWDIVDYAKSHDCRRRRILRYFGESYTERNCGCCDVCMRMQSSARRPRQLAS
jgi:ATP-dependent DNA helicase RecQ